MNRFGFFGSPRSPSAGIFYTVARRSTATYELLRDFLLLAFYLLPLFPTCATATPTDSPQQPITNPALVSQHFHQVLQRPEFQAPDETDVDTRFKDWLSLWFVHLGTKLGQFQYAQEMHTFSLLLLAGLVTLTFGGLLYIIIRFSRSRHHREESLPMETPGQKVFRPPEFYDEEIRRAIGMNNWHGAWLVTWRQFLSRLENRRLVEADRTRTNREYLAQLRQQAIPSSAFALLTAMVDAYDRFIYGLRPISESDWRLFHQQVNEAVLLLHLNEKPSRLDGKQRTA